MDRSATHTLHALTGAQQPATTQPQSPIPAALEAIEFHIAQLFTAARELEIRLVPVLTEKQPVDVPPEVNKGRPVLIAARIDEAATAVAHIEAMIRDIMERLQL